MRPRKAWTVDGWGPRTWSQQFVALIKAMRPHQWVKNLLISAPLLFRHAFSDTVLLGLSVGAFVLFCATASAIYLINDLRDMRSDRAHPVKRTRPLASGALNPRVALSAALVLLLASECLSALLLPWGFTLALSAYILMNACYTLWLKRKVMIDIIVLAGFYTLRIVAGGAATGIVPSEWLLALSLFLFLSLAFLKRYGELARLSQSGELRTDNRGYMVGDLELLQTMGLTCGYLSVLVLALYISSSQVEQLYRHPRMLWLACPLLLYWISRAWIWARRSAIREDPLMFAIKDRVSWGVLLLVAAIGIVAL